jgi:hypothetical protein
MTTEADKKGSVFVSYAREDRERVDGLVGDLRILAYDVWQDESLEGGQDWWNVIIEKIRGCDVFVQAVSTNALESEACKLERGYAKALRKPMVPVGLDPVGLDLPADLAGVQVVDFKQRSAETSLKLAVAMRECPHAPELPADMPDPPAAPVSYLVPLGERVRSADEMARSEQLDIVARLKGGLRKPRDRDDAIRLLRRMKERDDLLNSVAQDIDDALKDFAPAGTTAARPAADPPPVADPPPAVAPSPPHTAQPVTGTSVKTHMGLAIVSTVLFVFIGVFAIVAAARVKPALARGDLAEAQKSSKRARTIAWWAIGLFAVVVIIAAASSGSSSGS